MLKKKVNLSFEFFPPKGEKASADFWNVAQYLSRFKPKFISVTYGAGGQTRQYTQEIASNIYKKHGVSVAAHLTCVGSTCSEIDEIARGYWNVGIRHIVALRGDPPAGSGPYTPTPGGYPYSSHLVEGLKKLASFEVSVAGYPEKHPDAPSMEADLEALKKKVDAGADRVITQFFMETENFLRFRDHAVKMGIQVPIVPGILPIVNHLKAADFAKRCGAHMPGWVQDLFKDHEVESESYRAVAVALGMQQCENLLKHGVDHLHFYTLNKADPTQSICKHLGFELSNSMN